MRKRWLVFTMTAMCAFFASTLPDGKAKAADLTYYNSVETGQTDGEGYYIVKAESPEEVNNALKEAKENATDAKPYKIVVKPSDSAYTVSNMAFVLYNNVYLYAQGVTFQQEESYKNNMIRTGDSDDAEGYCYKNITIDGGIWDENGNANTLLKIAQAENVTIKNAVFKNSNKGHLSEIAGVKNVTVTNCSFEDQILNDKKEKIYEAIQLDILVEQHMNGYKSQDLANENITISDCTFKNVPRGIGSHTAILNHPMTGITITNNQFSDIKSCAVQLINAVECNISNNNIDGAPRGITILGGVGVSQDTYLATTLASEGATSTSTSTSYVEPAADMNIKIENNTIASSGTDPYADYERSGVFILGYNAKSNYKSSSGDTLPKGNYYLSGLSITGNTVTGNCHGVRLVDTLDSTVKDNTFTYTGTAGKVNYYGVNLKTDTDMITIENNTISGHINGIYLNEGNASLVSNNTIKTPKKYGISVENAKASTIEGNTIENAKINALYLHGGSAGTVSGNTLRNSGKYGISIEKGKAATIKGNTIETTTVNAIYVKESTAGNITGNTIKNAKKYGISIEKSKATSVSGNTLNNITKNGIHLWTKSTVNTISSNKLSSVKQRAIYVGGKSKVTTIKGNKMTSCKEKIVVQKGSTVKKKQK